MESKEKRLGTETLLYDNGKIWFTDISDNKLYVYDLTSKETTLFYTFKNEKKGGKRLFGNLTKKENLLFCIPFSASALYVIDVSTKKVREKKIKFPVQPVYKDYVPTSKFASAVWYGNSIFLVGATYPAVIRYDYIKDTMTYFTEWFNELQKGFKEERDFIFKKVCIDKNILYAPCCRSNSIFEMNLETLGYRIHSLNTSIKGFMAIHKEEDKFWLLPRKGEKVACWNVREQKVDEYVFLKNGQPYWNFYSDLIEADAEHLILLAGYAGDTLLLDTLKNEAEILDKRLHNVGNISYVGRDKKRIYAFSVSLGLLIVMTDKKIRFRHIYPPQHGENLKNGNAPSILGESVVSMLEDLIGEIDDTRAERLSSVHKSTYGKCIWDHMKMKQEDS